MKKIKLFFCINTRQGFTIAEMVVGVAILTIISLGVASLIQTVTTQQKQVVTRDEVSQFVASFSTWLRTDVGCKAALVGNSLPSTTAIPVVVNGFNGYGSSSAAGVSVQAGLQLSPNVKIVNMTWRDKGATPNLIRSNLNLYERRIAEFSIEFQTNVGNITTNERVRTFEIPVYIDPPTIAGRTIRDCYAEMTMSDVCAVMGNILDPVTGTCRPTSVCTIAGTYKTLSCAPSQYGCQSPVPTTLANPITATQSCPVGAIPSLTGVLVGQHTASCGKKCTIAVSNTLSFYVCMVCQ